MRAAKVLAVLAIAALGIGSFSVVAQAGKKMPTVKTPVVFSNQSPNFNNGQVNANGHVSKNDACSKMSMSLQLLNRNGVVLRKLDSTTSDFGWALSGHLPTLPAGTNYVRVKAKKATVLDISYPHHITTKQGVRRGPAEKQQVVCLAGFSRKVAIPAVSPP
jgi:hypothetical protein